MCNQILGFLFSLYSHIKKHSRLTIYPKGGINLRFDKNSHAGERCFIIGGGPSLNEIDLSKLNNEYCFAVNKGYLLKDKGLNKVDYYCIADGVASNDYGSLIDLSFSKHFIRMGNGHFGSRCNEKISALAIFEPGAITKRLSKGFFQFDIEKPLSSTKTVALYSLQVAVYLGFTDIYFIGVDNNFSQLKNIHWYNDSKKEKQAITFNIIKPEKDNEVAFQKAYSILKDKGVNIYNASVGGNLNSIPRVDYYDLFES